MTETEAALARKRRIAMRNQRSSSPTDEDDDSSIESNKRPHLMKESSYDDASESSSLVADSVSSKPKPHITGIKRLSRYDPGVPMTRDELKAWRKEARRVRNRESAAASRQKNRERITELELEVGHLKSKYAAALQLIIDYEARRNMKDYISFVPPALLRQDLTELRSADGAAVSEQAFCRPASPPADHNGVVHHNIQTVSPPLSPATPSPTVLMDNQLLFDTVHHHHDEQEHTSQYNTQHQHIIDMISRPIACV
jgi:hypothetical protein